MDIKLEDLIEKIKKEGIEEAEHSSQELLKKSQAEATSIIDQAKKEAAKIIEEANKHAEKMLDNARSSIRQAARDSLLAAKEEISSMINRMLKTEVTVSLSSDFMKQLILKIMDQWEPAAAKEIIISNEDVDHIRDTLINALQQKTKNEIIIKSSDNISKGFWVGLQGEDSYYEFSDDSIYNIFKSYLNPSIRNILDNHDG